MGVSMPSFVDICILAGCDYCDTIRGVAAITAYKLVKEKGDIHSVLVDIDKEKIPEGVDFDEVRALFITPDVADPETIDLKWGEPDEAGILQFLCKEKGFNEERISGGIKKLAKARSGGQQMRMDSYFSSLPSSAKPDAAGGKRKGDASKDKGKGGGAEKKLKSKK